MKETDLGKLLIPWLRNEGWDVYQEVSYRGRSADIVATAGSSDLKRFSARVRKPARHSDQPRRSSIIWIVELKLSLSETVILQAIRWKHLAHYVSVCVPFTTRSRWMAETCLRAHGIGLLLIDPDYEESMGVRRRLDPQINRNASTDIRRYLYEHQKTFASAGTSGARWTPFKQTCHDVESFVTANPGCTLSQLMQHLKHHYSSNTIARHSILQNIELGLINLVIDKRKKPFQLYPVDFSFPT